MQTFLAIVVGIFFICNLALTLGAVLDIRDTDLYQTADEESAILAAAFFTGYSTFLTGIIFFLIVL